MMRDLVAIRQEHDIAQIAHHDLPIPDIRCPVRPIIVGSMDRKLRLLDMKSICSKGAGPIDKVRVRSSLMQFAKQGTSRHAI